MVFDAAQVITDQWGDEVDLAQIDAISIWGWGETRFADFTLLGETHGVYSAFGQSLASAWTGDVLSPMAQAAAWARPDAGTALGWQSKPFDAELGLHYNNARWYSPQLGRFTQASPLGGTFEHLYGYGLNCPYGMTDINGLSPEDDYYNSLTDIEQAIYRRGEDNLAARALGLGPLYDYAPGGCYEEEFYDILFWGGMTVGTAYAIITFWAEGYIYKGFGALYNLLRGGKGFETHAQLVGFLGSAGHGMAWHHIVGQTPGNIARFGPQRIHNTRNVVRLPHGRGQLHNRITGFYNSIRYDITGSRTIRVREWIGNKSFRQQRRFALRAIRRISRGVW